MIHQVATDKKTENGAFALGKPGWRRMVKMGHFESSRYLSDDLYLKKKKEKKGSKKKERTEQNKRRRRLQSRRCWRQDSLSAYQNHLLEFSFFLKVQVFNTRVQTIITMPPLSDYSIPAHVLIFGTSFGAQLYQVGTD